MSTLDTILAAQDREVMSQARKRLSCHFKDPEQIRQGLQYVERRLDGRTPGPKPKCRTRVAHRLMLIDLAAYEKRLTDFLDLDNWE